MTPQERNEYRAIGGRLAVVLRQRQGERPSSAALQAIAADLVGDKMELLLPLKDLVSRPGFQLLVAKAGSGRGVVERRALLVDLERTFSPTVITALEELLGGFLDLPISSGQAPSKVQTELPSAARAQERANQRQREQSGPPPVAAPRTPSNKASDPVAMALGICVVTATLAIAAMAAIRSPLFCAALGLCPSSKPSTAVQQRLDSAQRAVADLESATSPSKYRTAAADLERELQRLRSETLTSEQHRQLTEFASISRKAQATVLQEEADQKQLQNESPRFGRPVFDPSDGYGWAFYKHLNGVDWYLDPMSKEYVQHGFKIMMRSVTPDNINFGPLQIDCKNKRFSAYYEGYREIDLSEDSLVTSLYKSNCDLPVAY